MSVRETKRGSVSDVPAAPLTVRFATGQEVLARWSDGLLYLGRILKVDNAGDRCFIKFEDDSEHWALFKDMFKAASRREISCRQCCNNQSEAPNEIVLCDNCGAGYHQSCHIPQISSEVLQPNVKWQCRLCVFTSTAKRGGALKRGPNAKAFHVMKQSLPYNACDLKWDGEHKSNVDQCFCYCGGPGEWYVKMLQCCRCRQWFHEACLQCLDFPLVLGDRWYVFVCAICNGGMEYLKRLDLKWVDIAQLALFNLTMEHNTKYYDLSESIVPWILQHWDTLQLTQVKEKSKVNIENLLQDKLMSNSGRFACGKEIKKRATLWGLRFRLPPLPPSVVLPAEGQITDECMKNIQKRGRNTKTFVPFHSNLPIPLKCRKRKEQPSPITQRSAKMKKLMDSVCEKGRKQGKVESANQNYKGFTGSQHIANGKSPVNGKSPRKGKSSAQRSKCNLDSIIPRLQSYAGFNHPFKTVLEKTEEIEKQKRNSELLVALQNGCDTDTDTMSQSSQGDETEIEQSDSSHTVDMNYIPRIMKKHRRKMSRPHREVLSSVIMQGVFEPPSKPEKVPNSLITDSPSTTVTRSSKSPDVVDSATIEAVKSHEISFKQLKSSVKNYFGTAERIAQGESFRILARRITPEKKVQYLVEWESSVP